MGSRRWSGKRIRVTHPGIVGNALGYPSDVADNVTFENFAPAQPTQKKMAVHAQVAF
jgi:hypothetical protein